MQCHLTARLWTKWYRRVAGFHLFRCFLGNLTRTLFLRFYELLIVLCKKISKDDIWSLLYTLKEETLLADQYIAIFTFLLVQWETFVLCNPFKNVRQAYYTIPVLRPILRSYIDGANDKELGTDEISRKTDKQENRLDYKEQNNQQSDRQ